MKKLILILTATVFFAYLYGAGPGMPWMPGGGINTGGQPNQATNTSIQPSPTTSISGQPSPVTGTASQVNQALKQAISTSSQQSQQAQISPEEEAKMDSETLYNSLTTSADYSYRPQYESVTHTPRDLFQDIKVSAVESVPFALAYSFLGIAIYESIKQQQIPPAFHEVNYYRTPLIIAASCFAAVNIGVNVFTYYKYDKKEVKADATVKKEK